MKKKKGMHQPVPLAVRMKRQKLVYDEISRQASSATTQAIADMQTQRALWLAVCSVADAFGVGPKRMMRFFEALQENVDDYERMKVEGDEEYANEKLRLRAERVTGREIGYLFEQELRENGVG